MPSDDNPRSELTSVEEVLTNPATSYWLKEAIRALLDRDPLDASRDAYKLHCLMQERLNIALHPCDATSRGIGGGPDASDPR